MADKRLAQFTDDLGAFAASLSTIYDRWFASGNLWATTRKNQSVDWPPADEENWSAFVAASNTARNARDCIHAQAAAVVTLLPAPAGRTAAEWLADIRGWVENAWELCRLTYIYGPGPEPKPCDPEDARLRKEMRNRLPQLADWLRKAWLRVHYFTQHPRAAHSAPPIAESKASWYHPLNSHPRDEYPFGPLSDNAANLNYALGAAQNKDARQFEKKGRLGIVWVERAEGTRGHYDVYFRRQDAYDSAKRRLATRTTRK